MATKMTAKQLEQFRKEYVSNELDVLYTTMSDSEIEKLMGTTDRAKVTELLKDGIKDMKTKEDVIEGFSDGYAHIFD